MKSLERLNLASNQLSGSLPESIGSLMLLKELRLSLNHISGNIPPSLFACRQLEVIDFADNELTGAVSDEIPNFRIFEGYRWLTIRCKVSLDLMKIHANNRFYTKELFQVR